MRMEDETFDEFYAKLKDIVNFAFNLREFIDESKIVRKIFRSLFERNSRKYHPRKLPRKHGPFLRPLMKVPRQ